MSFNAIISSSIMQKGFPATAGSKMLENFSSPVNATVVERLEAAGVVLAGRFDTDEFGVGGLFGCETGETGDGSLSYLMCETGDGFLSYLRHTVRPDFDDRDKTKSHPLFYQKLL